MNAIRILPALALGIFASLAMAAPVAVLKEVQGIATLQTPGQPARFVQQGESLNRGETISTSAKGYAVLTANDGSQITLRPSTSFAFDAFETEAGKENAVMRLFRGGMRALTGFLGKRNPNAVKVISPTATIGIRGTDFDARICGKDCAQEAGTMPMASRGQIGDLIAARVAFISGKARVSGPSGGRELVAGSPLYAKDRVTTEAATNLVLAFSDRTRVTLQQNTIFEIEGYKFSEKAAESNAAVKLLRGGLRFFTGLIGKRNPESFKVATPTATIGIRGTGADVLCVGLCADPSPNQAPIDDPAANPPGAESGLFVYTWEGSVYVRFGQSFINVGLNEIAFIDPLGRSAAILPTLPPFLNNPDVPRPDGVPVDHDNLFGTQSSNEDQPGLYVVVRDGHITVYGPTGQIDLGKDEVAFLQEGATIPIRLNFIPRVIMNDPVPRPGTPPPTSIIPPLVTPFGNQMEEGCEVWSQ